MLVCIVWNVDVGSYFSQSFGLEARKVPSEQIEDRVADCVAQGYTLVHSFDDASLVLGYAR